MTRRIFAMLIVGAIFASGGTAWAAEAAVYAGPPNPDWISGASVERETKDIEDGIAAMFQSFTIYRDGDEKGPDSPLAKWTEKRTDNGVVDVLILSCGTMPSGLYPFPNAEPDGSVIEEFIDHGNVVINIADWFGYMSYEGHVRSAENGGAGAQNIFDAPIDFNSRSNVMKVNDNGRKYLPSLRDLEEFTTDRPWHLETLNGTPWEVTTFAEAGPNDADPAVAKHSETGGIIACLMQKAWPNPSAQDDIRGELVVEFIENWLAGEGHITLSVDPTGKASTSWGVLKTR